MKPAGQGMAYMKFSHPASRYAVLGVAAVVSLTDGTCTAARVAIGGLLPAPVRCTDVERTIERQRISSESVSRAAAEVHRVVVPVLQGQHVHPGAVADDHRGGRGVAGGAGVHEHHRG